MYLTALVFIADTPTGGSTPLTHRDSGLLGILAALAPKRYRNVARGIPGRSPRCVWTIRSRGSLGSWTILPMRGARDGVSHTRACLAHGWNVQQSPTRLPMFGT